MEQKIPTPASQIFPDRSASPAHQNPPKKTFWQSTLELVRFVAIVLAIVLPIRFFVVEPFIVNGASMDPTFATGQFLMVDRLSYRLSSPDRGDVLVFKYPNNPKVYYIKRVIGLPGETVSIKEGRVTITNTAHPTGFMLAEPYIESVHASSDTSKTTLGIHEYFVMGDNRSQSSDSRVWGPLDATFIIGRPIVRIFPIQKAGILPGRFNE